MGPKSPAPASRTPRVQRDRRDCSFPRRSFPNGKFSIAIQRKISRDNATTAIRDPIGNSRGLKRGAFFIIAIPTAHV